MLIAATTAVAVLAASTPLLSRPLVELPPVTITISVAPDISPSLVKRVLREATEIWRPAGVTFDWRRGALEVVPYARMSETGPYRSATPRIVIGHGRGMALGAWSMPLGWIVFDDVSTPEQDIYLSYSNAFRLLELSRDSVGFLERMPRAEKEELLGRAMGRALAHEIGHYLLASKAHGVSGLMKARHTAAELFGLERVRFQVDAEERAAIAARLAPALMARRQSLLEQ